MERRDLVAGARDAVPVVLGVVPFALVAGYAAVEAGLSTAAAVGASVVVFAGASQLAAYELLGSDAPLAVVVLTAVVINLRMMMYSASLAPHLRDVGRRARAGAAYFLTDQAFALSVSRYREETGTDRLAYYLGAAVLLWLCWQVGTVAGVALGTGVPPEWGLEFAAPLVFLALLVPALEDRPSVAAAVVAGAVALVGADAPLNVGLLLGATAGIATGLLVERRTGRGGDAGGEAAGTEVASSEEGRA
jgi:4-azaleucine resistance transporter AzlC